MRRPPEQGRYGAAKHPRVMDLDVTALFERSRERELRLHARLLQFAGFSS